MELSEELAFDRIEPLDTAWRIECAIGTLCSLIYWANKGEHAEALGPKDFIKEWDADPEEKAAGGEAELARRLEALASFGQKRNQLREQPE